MRPTAPAPLAVLACLAAAPALADAIDGDWCSREGRMISIRGSEIVTPGGTRMRGDYDRHHFHYVVPASEPGAGMGVYMSMRGDLLVHLRMGADAAAAAAAPVQEWRRCAPATS
jgi:hypothetical protein